MLPSEIEHRGLQRKHNLIGVSRGSKIWLINQRSRVRVPEKKRRGGGGGGAGRVDSYCTLDDIL